MAYEDEAKIVDIKQKVQDLVAKEKSSLSAGITKYQHIIELCIDASDFISRELPKREWLIEGLLYRGQLAMVFAKPGVGKTWLALAMAVVCSRGGNLFGPYKVDNPCGVIYLDAEMPAVEMQERLRSMWIKPGPAPFKLISSELLSQDQQPTPLLTSKEWRGALTSYCTAHPEYRLLVLDNISSLTPGQDESDKLDWDDINQWLMGLRRTGLTVLIVHHAGKNGDQRGTSAREDQLDLVLKVSQVEERKRTTFKVGFQKGRSLRGDERKPFVIEIVTNERGEAVLSYRLANQDRVALIAWHISQGLKQSQIANQLGIGQGTVSKSIRKAKEQGILSKDDCLTEYGAACCAGMDDD